MPTTVISSRVDETIRQRVDVVLRKEGLRPSEVVQQLWTYIAQTGTIPPAARPTEAADEKQEALAHLASFLDSLPPANPAYADWSDEEVLALKAHDYV